MQPESFWSVYSYGGVAVLIYVVVAWLASLSKKDTSIVDIFWGPGFLLTTLVYFAFTDGWFTRKLVIVVLVAVWATRLAVYIGIRNHGQAEDPRYRAWRDKHGSRWPIRSLVTVFLLQGLLMWLVSLPLLGAQIARGAEAITFFDVAGICFWVIGFLWETISDHQLFRFKQNRQNKGKVMCTGLWRYSRHPNYFGEFLLWWGYGMIGIASSSVWILISPIIMSILLMKFSGVGLLEKGLKSSKPGYQDYIMKTKAFFPWLPKSPSQSS